MKRVLSFLLALLLVMSVNVGSANAKTREMRGAWISSVYNSDWPSSGSKNNPELQKQELVNMLDRLSAVGINSVFLQVRPKSDALYKSNINPWSDVLTGTQGKDPGYDPLQFAIDEAHKRGMELHAWLNPYRVTTSGTDLEALASNNPARQNPSWVVTDGKALFFDPGNPSVKLHLINTVMEIVNNYNVDGIHFDDYFYKGSFNDEDSYSKYGNGMNKEDWRRENVNSLVREVRNNIKAAEPSVQFGISPRGIWKNKSSDTAGSDTTGVQSYYADYADTVAWIKNGWVDYVAPQLYWTIGQAGSDYKILADWWSNQVKGTNVQLYIGQGIYKSEVVGEITKQVELNRSYSEISGSIYFSTRDILSNSSLQQQLKALYVDSVQKNTMIGYNRYETATKISREGWTNGADTVVLVNGYAFSDGTTATPLAATYDAPLLLTDPSTLTSYTRDEIRRLSPKNVILVGGEGVISNNIVSEIKAINGNINVRRIGGRDRYETSLNIAKAIDEVVDVNNAYICYGYGEADALSISAKAGTEKTPIVLAYKETLGKYSYEWLMSEGIQNAYFIGGTGIIHDSVISEVNGITALDVSGNRIAGSTRYETNAEVIKRFYGESIYSSIITTKGEELADALTAGPFAARLNSPVVLMYDSLRPAQRSILGEKSSKLVYEIGGGINQLALQELITLIQ